MKANEIRDYCEQHTMSLGELAKAAAVPYVTVWRAANGLTNPRASTARAIKLAMVYNPDAQPRSMEQ